MFETGFSPVNDQPYLGPAHLTPGFAGRHMSQYSYPPDVQQAPLYDLTSFQIPSGPLFSSDGFTRTSGTNDAFSCHPSGDWVQYQPAESIDNSNAVPNRSSLHSSWSQEAAPQRLFDAHNGLSSSLKTSKFGLEGAASNEVHADILRSTTACDTLVSSSKDPDYSPAPKTRRKQRYRVEKTKPGTRHLLKTASSSKVRAPTAPQAIQSSTPREQSLDHVTIAACHLWLQKNPANSPSEHIVSCLSFLYGGSPQSIRKWFSRNVVIPEDDGDTDYRTVLTSGHDIASHYRRNRRECTRGVDNIGSAVLTSMQSERDEMQSFACTSRCGKTFSKKADWKRHEEINRPPKVWLCNLGACPSDLEKRRPFFRKDHFQNHLAKNHANVIVTKRDIAACCTPIKFNFSRYCIFRDCDERFGSWKKRIDHIAEHFKKSWDMSQWRDTDDDPEDTGEVSSQMSSSHDSGSEQSTDDHNMSDSDDSDNSDGPPPNAGKRPDDSFQDPSPRFRGSRKREGPSTQQNNGTFEPFSGATSNHESSRQVVLRKCDLFQSYTLAGDRPEDQSPDSRILYIIPEFFLRHDLWWQEIFRPGILDREPKEAIGRVHTKSSGWWTIMMMHRSQSFYIHEISPKITILAYSARLQLDVNLCTACFVGRRPLPSTFNIDKSSAVALYQEERWDQSCYMVCTLPESPAGTLSYLCSTIPKGLASNSAEELQSRYGHVKNRGLINAGIGSSVGGHSRAPEDQDPSMQSASTNRDLNVQVTASPKGAANVRLSGSTQASKEQEKATARPSVEREVMQVKTLPTATQSDKKNPEPRPTQSRISEINQG